VAVRRGRRRTERGRAGVRALARLCGSERGASKIVRRVVRLGSPWPPPAVPVPLGSPRERTWIRRIPRHPDGRRSHRRRDRLVSVPNVASMRQRSRSGLKPIASRSRVVAWTSRPWGSAAFHAGPDIDPIGLDPLRRPAIPGRAVEQQPAAWVSCTLAAVTRLARTKPIEQVKIWRLMPFVFLLPS